MEAVGKVRERIRCGICKKRFRPTCDFECLCEGCRDTLPKCDSCGSVMCVGFGYREQFARTVGRYRICTSCDHALRTRGYLRPSQTEKVLPSGKVVKVRPALRGAPNPVKKRTDAT